MPILNRVALAGICLLPLSCGAILEEMKLEDQTQITPQQDLDLKFQALTFAAAYDLNMMPFERLVERAGSGQAARIVDEHDITHVHRFSSTKPLPYHIGVGDVLQLSIYVTSRALEPQESVGARSSRVTADGSVLFIETGKLELEGKTLAEARDLVANALIRNGVDPRFQLEVSGFNSQRVSLTYSRTAHNPELAANSTRESAPSGGTFPITETPTSLRDLLVASGIAILNDRVQIVSVTRKGKRYHFPLEHVFKPQSPNYFLTGGDLINIEEFFYHQGRAFLVSEDSESIALEVRPEKRPTLADLLFSGDEQIFSNNAARTKEIYMMRGTRPMQVFHLNAQDPSRLRVATEVELRPDDIVFVSRKPIYSVSELINIINPLAVLARSGS